MDKSGRIYSRTRNEVGHHSAFLADNPVAAVGTIRVKNGEVTGLYNQSRHDQAPQDDFNQLHTELKKQGVRIRPDALVNRYASSKQIEKKSKKNAAGRPVKVEFSQSTRRPTAFLSARTSLVK
jgi:hypothetical protein